LNLSKSIGFSAKLRRNLSVLAVVCLNPFALFHLLAGQQDLAFLLMALIAVLTSSAWALHIRGNSVWSGGLVMAVSVISVLFAVQYRGVESVVWAYPVVLLLHLVLERKQALLASLLFIGATLGVAGLMAEPSQITRFGATLLLASGFAYVFSDRHAKQQRKLSRLVRIDPLTGAYNRRHLEDSLEQAVSNKERYERPISLVLVDLDRFKHINDNHGHKAGDDVLIWVVRTVLERVRKSDRLCRYGGDEFILMMPQTDLQTASTVAEDIKVLVAQHSPFEFDLSISIGVAELCKGESAESWLRRADHALYEAKNSGRDRVTLSPSTVAVNE
jgi:diguanylate cyclase (GGDEF)-like protein